ncbi:hypothetical protein GCM10010990_36200 [Croceicoccus mobilis]|uniref:Uncharacterized protein n=1 Tax=Croceicoccus mobilis TaxID=1703339 RepID=A0A916ZAV7_9SPHN|nr:hypothetical protein GCM10010990_36200 [Croceicoccus mobilis]
MSYASGYRQNAADERYAASRATMPHIKDKHLKAASRWDALADELSRQFSAG